MRNSNNISDEGRKNIRDFAKTHIREVMDVCVSEETKKTAILMMCYNDLEKDLKNFEKE